MNQSSPSQLSRNSELPIIFRGTLGFPSLLKETRFLLHHERNPKFHTATREEAQFPCSVLGGPLSFPLTTLGGPIPCFNSRGTPISPLHSRGTLPLHDRRPDPPLSTREEPRNPCHNSRGTLSCLLQVGRRYNSSAVTRETLSSPRTIQRRPYYLLGTQRNTEITGATREEPQDFPLQL